MNGKVVATAVLLAVASGVAWSTFGARSQRGCSQKPNTTTLPFTFGVGQIGEVIPAATATR